jgi:tetratricopeptide (TPR) repeat protein
MSETSIKREPLDSTITIIEPLKRLKKIEKIEGKSETSSNMDDDLFSPQVPVQSFNNDTKVVKERRIKAYKKMEQARKKYDKAQDEYRKNYEKAEDEYNKALDKYNKALSIVEDEYNKAVAYYRGLFPTTKGGKTRRLKSHGRKTRSRKYL